jgi:hypothetical protein
MTRRPRGRHGLPRGYATGGARCCHRLGSDTPLSVAERRRWFPATSGDQPDVRNGKIHSDDTSVPFLERGRDEARDGHLWVYIGDRDHSFAVFDFTEHHRRDGPEQFLKGYAGYLQADALAQYEGLFATGEVIHVACNAHARRRFVEAQSSAPDEAEEALKYIRKLYRAERELAGRFAADDDAGRQQYRSAQTGTVREEFHAWLLGQQPRALPKSPLGEAVGYALSNWAALMRYTE